MNLEEFEGLAKQGRQPIILDSICPHCGAKTDVCMSKKLTAYFRCSCGFSGFWSRRQTIEMINNLSGDSENEQQSTVTQNDAKCDDKPIERTDESSAGGFSIGCFDC
nr:hypothetical protein 5 [bacterium]